MQLKKSICRLSITAPALLSLLDSGSAQTAATVLAGDPVGTVVKIKSDRSFQAPNGVGAVFNAWSMGELPSAQNLRMQKFIDDFKPLDIFAIAKYPSNVTSGAVNSIPERTRMTIRAVLSLIPHGADSDAFNPALAHEAPINSNFLVEARYPAAD